MINRIGTALAVAALVALTMLACAVQPPRGRYPVTVNVGLISPCVSEDGAGMDQAYPCVWDCRVQGNRRCGGDPPVTLYQASTCEPATLPLTVRCIDVRAWLDPTAAPAWSVTP